jgi:hypothetical protein
LARPAASVVTLCEPRKYWPEAPLASLAKNSIEKDVFGWLVSELQSPAN